MRRLLNHLTGRGALRDAEMAIVLVVVGAVFVWLMKSP